MAAKETCDGDSCFIKENDYVIVKKNDFTKAFQVIRNRPVWIGKQKIFLDGIVGFEFGSFFEYKDDKMTKIEESGPKMETELIDKDEISATVKDNRALVDDGKSQKLCKDDIESLKKQGASGKEIVDHLIANSATFNEKTEFSQEKYLKKKQKKYANIFRILKPNTRLIVDMYNTQGPLKIMNLRSDSLGQILAYSNVHSGGKYLVFESCMGLVVASVMERIGKDGCVIQVYDLDIPQQQAVHLHNFPEETKNCLCTIKLDKFSKLHEEDNLKKEQEKSDKDEPVDGKKMSGNRQKLNNEAERAKEILRERDLDGIIISSKYSPVEPLFMFLDFIKLSRSFVVYSIHQEPLIECYTKLKESNRAISLWLTETWMQEYQVLPNRTHPSVNMTNSGFILHGIKVDNS